MSAQLISATTPDANIDRWRDSHLSPSAHPRTASGAYARIMSDAPIPASLRLADADSLTAWARGAADVLMERDSTPETMTRAARVSCMVADAKSGADPERDDSERDDSDSAGLSEADRRDLYPNNGAELIDYLHELSDELDDDSSICGHDGGK